MNSESFEHNILFPKIAYELKKMEAVDQEIRKRSPEEFDGIDHDKIHTERMKEIVAEIGWPTISKVGVEGADYAWTLVQHIDRKVDLDFQVRCLQLMKEALSGEVDITNIAYLEDRVRVNQDRGQLYGTQFNRIDGKYIPKLIEDEANVDARRALIGMGPLQEQIDMMYEAYGSDQDSKEL